MDPRDRGRRRIARIQFVGQPVDRHDPVGVQEQDRQNGALTRTAKADRAVGADGLQWAEDAELEVHR